MSGLFDSDRSEVNRDDVKRGVGGSLENTTQMPDETVRTVSFHRVDHHAARSAAGKGLHNGRRQCGDDIRRKVEKRENVRDSVHDEIHCAACPERGDSHENGDQVGDDHNRGLETFLRAFDKGFESLDPFTDGESQKGDDDSE